MPPDPPEPELPEVPLLPLVPELPEVPPPVPPLGAPVLGAPVLGALGATAPPLLELELELLLLARAAARGADRGAALLEAIGRRGALRIRLGAVQLGLELARVLAALDGQADLLARGDLVGHRLQELVQGGVAGGVELLDLVDHALAELRDLGRLALALARGRELLDRAVRLGAGGVGLSDELGLAQGSLRGLSRDRDRGLRRAVTAAGGEHEPHAEGGGEDEEVPHAPHTAGQGSRLAGKAFGNWAPGI